MAGISATQALNGTTATNAASSSSTSQSKLLDMNAFLRMFTTQLQYQDPTNPLESYELSAQLAQFSTVEKLTDISSKLEAQQKYLESLTNTQLVQMIGKSVVGAYDGLQVTDGSASKGYYELPTQAANVTIRIISENGTVVRTLDQGAKAAGTYEIDWNGKDESGNTLPNGTYHFDVTPLAADGSTLEATEFVKGTAVAFRMVNGTGYLVLEGDNGLLLPAASISEVHSIG